MGQVEVPYPLDNVLRPAAIAMVRGDMEEEYGVELGRGFESLFLRNRRLILLFLIQEVARESRGRKTVRQPNSPFPSFANPILTVCVIHRTAARMRQLVNGRVDYLRSGETEYMFFEGPRSRGVALLRSAVGNRMI